MSNVFLSSSATSLTDSCNLAHRHPFPPLTLFGKSANRCRGRTSKSCSARIVATAISSMSGPLMIRGRGKPQYLRPSPGIPDIYIDRHMQGTMHIHPARILLIYCRTQGASDPYLNLYVFVAIRSSGGSLHTSGEDLPSTVLSGR
ncbi:hypothetical protein PISMIDRAFT_680924 [Pisolithus microcarpus 441]|uniref:Uncharacterized protein n=1 Tax=Pisolithus microcarpus 441 TaxID=765257 RepID=A0A0C9YYF5_9AGAM|nr:hypothetical protein PISMIDRAFT_680924 [Pisolithus microcarpus 441]